MALKNAILHNYWFETVARNIRSSFGFRQFINNEFTRWFEFFQQSEQWNLAQIQQWQSQAFADLMRAIPREIRLKHEELLMCNDDVNFISLLEKFAICDRNSFRYLYDINLSKKNKGIVIGSTSGTSGNPLQFFHDRSDAVREWAAICHQWRRIGFDPYKSIRGELRGLIGGGKLVQRFADANMIRFSILHTKVQHVRLYSDICRSESVKFLHGYPSAVHLVANQILSNGLRFEGIRGIMLSSEMVYPHQIESIQSAFPYAKIIAHYGNAERTALGAWCEHSQNYHFMPLYSIVEVEPDSGSLIGTNLFNTVNPFIRYRMDDSVSGARYGKCEACGRIGYPLVEHLNGRDEDYLFSPKLGFLPPAIITYPLKSLTKIKEMQLFQSAPEVVELRYVSHDEEDCNSELIDVVNGLSKLLVGVKIVTMQRDSLIRGSGGKVKWIISELQKSQISK